MKRALIYVRVSTAEQASDGHASLQVQEERCRAYVQQQGWTLVRVESDTESGMRPERAGYQRALALARAGSVDAIVVFHASRFGRKAWELLRVWEELREMNVQLVSTAEDMTSFLMTGIHALMGENETRILVARTMPSKRAKTAQGYWLAHPPFGTVNEKGVLKPGERFDLVRLAFELCADGLPVTDIVRRINGAVAPDIVRYHRIIKTLRNELYIGVVRWGGVEAKAQWEPLIEPDLFARAQAQLRKRYVERRQLTRSYPYWILGLAFCARCGHRMHPKVHISKWAPKAYPYIVCGRKDRLHFTRLCTGPYVNIVELQDWVVARLEDLRLDGPSVDAYLARLAAEHDRDDGVILERRRSLEVTRSRLEKRVLAAKSAYLDAPDTFTVADVRRVQAAVADQVAAIDRELAQPPPDPTIDAESMRRFLLEAGWLEIRHTAPAEFRAFLRRFVGRVVVGSPGDYAIEWQPVVERVFSATST